MPCTVAHRDCCGFSSALSEEEQTQTAVIFVCPLGGFCSVSVRLHVCASPVLGTIETVHLELEGPVVQLVAASLIGSPFGGFCRFSMRLHVCANNPVLAQDSWGPLPSKTKIGKPLSKGLACVTPDVASLRSVGKARRATRAFSAMY